MRDARAWFSVVSAQDFDAAVAKLLGERQALQPATAHIAGRGQSDDRELLSNDHLAAERPTSALLPSAARGTSGNEASPAQSPTVYIRPGSAAGPKVAVAQASGVTASMEGDTETAGAHAGAPATVIEEDVSSESSCPDAQTDAAATQDLDANAENDEAASEIDGGAGDAAPKALEDESDDAASEIDGQTGDDAAGEIGGHARHAPETLEDESDDVASEVGGQTGDDDAAGEIGGHSRHAALEALEDEGGDGETPTNRASAGLTGGANAQDVAAVFMTATIEPLPVVRPRVREAYVPEQRTTGNIKRGCILYTWDKGLQQNKVPYWIISDATLNEPMIGEPMIGLLFVSSLTPLLVRVGFAWGAHS